VNSCAVFSQFYSVTLGISGAVAVSDYAKERIAGAASHWNTDACAVGRIRRTACPPDEE
jgi:hypothetical protein